ncbi:MAG TPA: YihY/virulence factor BrkB family protein [Terriglobales bacterium]|nr:YihY/virulence factor BrkB family protein [Terriglobales bacterium]
MQLLFGKTTPRYPRLRHTASYLAAAETHTYASSVAAHALLSFFPFIVLLLTLTRNFLHSDRLYHSLLQLLRAYLPVADVGDAHTQTFIITNLQVIVEHQKAAQAALLLILLFTCTGIFLPLEVALNRVWGAARNRNYFHNWAVAIGLAFGCGVLGMLSASFTALTETYSTRLYHYLSQWRLLSSHAIPLDVFAIAVVRAGAVPFTIAIFFFVYWRLPNTSVPVGRVLPAAVTAGLLWEISKYIYILLLPWLNFADIYGPFAISISLLLWAYFSALILLTCADMAAPLGAGRGHQTAFDFEPVPPAGVESFSPPPPSAAGPNAAPEPEVGQAALPRT